MRTTNFLRTPFTMTLYLNYQNNPNQMKSKFYIFFILLLSFTVAQAQSEDKVNETLSQEVVVETNNDVEVINTLELKKAISKTSDIRNFLNRERNVENIKLVFPKINRRKTA